MSVSRSFRRVTALARHASVKRSLSSCSTTMDLLAADDASPVSIQSTLQYLEHRDVSASFWHPSSTKPTSVLPTKAEQLHPEPHSPSITTQELDLLQASQLKQEYDKILLVFRPGLELPAVHPTETPDDETTLSSRGIGQALTLARRTAAFLNQERDLEPELVVLAPFLHCLQTALLALPTFSPQCTGIRNLVPWMCHPDLYHSLDQVRQIERYVYGVDCSLCHNDANTKTMPLQHPADRFRSWIQERPEKVIVIGANDDVLQELSYSLHYVSEKDIRNGEMRALGVCFD